MKVTLSIALVATIALTVFAGARWIAATPQSGKSQATVETPLQTEAVTLKVTGMTCSGCEAAVRSAARQIPGVTDVTASYEHGVAEVTYDPRRTTPDAIARAITEGSGFEAAPPVESGR
jgi:copper chaperone CopZ